MALVTETSSLESLEDKVASIVHAMVELVTDLGSALALIEKQTTEKLWWTTWAIATVIGLFVVHLLTRLRTQLAMLNRHQEIFERMWSEDRANDERVRVAEREHATKLRQEEKNMLGKFVQLKEEIEKREQQLQQQVQQQQQRLQQHQQQQQQQHLQQQQQLQQQMQQLQQQRQMHQQQLQQSEQLAVHQAKRQRIGDNERADELARQVQRLDIARQQAREAQEQVQRQGWPAAAAPAGPR